MARIPDSRVVKNHFVYQGGPLHRADLVRLAFPCHYLYRLQQPDTSRLSTGRVHGHSHRVELPFGLAEDQIRQYLAGSPLAWRAQPVYSANFPQHDHRHLDQ